MSGGRSRLAAATAVTGALLVPLATFGAPALARSGAASEYQYGGSGSSQYQYRVTICHVTGSKKHPAHTITVSSAAVAKHIKHGDHLGPCTGAEKPKLKTTKPVTQTVAPAAPASDNGGHGKGHKK
ncbi:MAG: hypothetical protein ACJ76I_12375 [Gaiellaceae bacterium]